jgi:hypothetical protein
MEEGRFRASKAAERFASRLVVADFSPLVTEEKASPAVDPTEEELWEGRRGAPLREIITKSVSKRPAVRHLFAKMVVCRI